MDFFTQTGKTALGSRVRLMAEAITGEAASIYQAYGSALQPKWFPVVYYLSKQGSDTITGIARAIRHSHPSVSKTVREMTAAGYVSGKADKGDARRNRIQLSAKGRAAVKKMQQQISDVGAAVEEMSAGAKHDLWQALEEWEVLLNEKSLLDRVLAVKAKREGRAIRIIVYQPAHQQAFHDLNEEWISANFKMEASDYKALDKPNEYILSRGGAILMAMEGKVAVGTCALIKMDDPDFDYEVAKMAVAPAARGKGVGYLLGKAVIGKARELGAQKIYLESNTKLKPAMKLYQKLGFREIKGRPTPYERCNIQMWRDVRKP